MLVKSRLVLALLEVIFLSTDITFSQITTEVPLSNCPDIVQTSICVCSDKSDVVGAINLDCSAVQSEGQLLDFFSTFPVTDVYLLTISSNNKLLALSSNVFGNVTFRSLHFSNWAVYYIDESAFSNSYSTLQEWRMSNCQLLSQGFPFGSLGSYSELDTLVLEAAGKFQLLPRLTSDSLSTLSVVECELQFFDKLAIAGLPNLTYLFMYDNLISSLSNGLFDENPLVEQVYLHNNKIENITLGTFRNLPALTLLNLGSNKISYIQPGAFWNLPMLNMLYLRNNELNLLSAEMLGDFPSLTNLYFDDNHIRYLDPSLLLFCPNIQYVFASSNNLTNIPAGTFDVMKSGYLLLENNFLTTLNENWLKPLLRNSNTVFLSSNPLDCGCDMAWLIDDTSLLNYVTAQCNNGTSIRDLDSSYFYDNC